MVFNFISTTPTYQFCPGVQLFSNSGKSSEKSKKKFQADRTERYYTDLQKKSFNKSASENVSLENSRKIGFNGNVYYILVQ
jgi:hypothetical protein